MAKHLQLAPQLALPLDAATSTFGILATKGAGKSNAAVVMAEEMFDAGVPWVAIDPKGDWWGIRASADGKTPGLPIIVFGGRHGDIPLEPTAGAMLADLILEHRVSCVLDVSEFTKGETIRFLRDFGARLFRQAHDEVLHLFLEEAHEYLPQMVKGDQAEMVGTWQRIVKQGRFKGLGVTLISQRSASLNKDVLELVDTLIVLRTVGPRSRDAIKAWITDQDVDGALLASLPTLGNGEAWVWSPGVLHVMKKVQFRQRRTFDSGATPQVGKPRPQPKTLADIDLGAIKDAMAETVEKAKDSDPKELRRRLHHLEAELAAARAELAGVVDRADVEPEVIELEVPLLTTLEEQHLEALNRSLREAMPALEAVMNHCGQLSPRVRATAGPSGTEFDWNAAAASRRAATPVPGSRVPGTGGGGGQSGPIPSTAGGGGGMASLTTSRFVATPKAPAGAAPPDGAVASDALREILTVLAQHPLGKTGQQLAVHVGKRYSGGFRNYLATSRTAGWIVGGNSDRMRITEEGLEALGDYTPLPVGRDLLEHWLGKLSPAEADVLRVVAAAHPESVDGATVASDLGKQYSGGFRNYLSKLRTLGVIVGGNAAMRLADDLVGA